MKYLYSKPPCYPEFVTSNSSIYRIVTKFYLIFNKNRDNISINYKIILGKTIAI